MRNQSGTFISCLLLDIMCVCFAPEAFVKIGDMCFTIPCELSACQGKGEKNEGQKKKFVLFCVLYMLYIATYFNV